MLRKLKPFKFIDQVVEEVKKIVWPGRSELIASAIVVIVVVLIFSVLTMLTDYGIHSLVNFLLNIGK